MDCHKLQVNSSCQMVCDASRLEVFEIRSVARYPRRHDSVAGWNECIRSFRPSAFGLWVVLLFEYTMPFSSFFFEDRDSTRGHKKGRDSSQVWTKHLLCEWAIHQACDKRCWTDELGSDAKSRGPGLRFVHKSCLARGHFWVFDESEAFMATRGAKCLVLHVGQPSKFGYWSVAANSSDSPFALALRASKIVLVVPNRHQSVYTRLWCGYEAYLAEKEGKTIVIAKDSRLHDVRHLGCAFNICFLFCSFYVGG